MSDTILYYHATLTERVEAILETGLWARKSPPKSQWKCSGVYASASVAVSRRWAQEIVNMIGEDTPMTIIAFEHPGGFSISSYGQGVGDQVHFRTDVMPQNIQVIENFDMEAEDEPVYRGKQWA